MAFVDFHVHTLRSDGTETPESILAQARACGIGTLAITDHNYALDPAPYREAYPDIRLIQGCEFSSKYLNSKGKEQELHIVGLGFDPNHPLIQEVLRKNQPDRKPYINAILAKLRELDIHVGTYEELMSEHPHSLHVGRTHIAMKMHRLGYVSSPEEAFDEYIGGFGRRRAYVKNPLTYVSPQECIHAIREAGGIPILAHLYYYQLEEVEQRELLRLFKSLAGDRAGIETDYAAYSPEQRESLRRLAKEYALLPSAASDYHGKHKGETLAQGFPSEDFQALLSALGINE